MPFRKGKGNPCQVPTTVLPMLEGTRWEVELSFLLLTWLVTLDLTFGNVGTDVMLLATAQPRIVSEFCVLTPLEATDQITCRMGRAGAGRGRKRRRHGQVSIINNSHRHVTSLI